MRIAANLDVLDEIEFIEICIRHLRAIGVDTIVVTDLGSIDGTADLLEKFARDPDISSVRSLPKAKQVLVSGKIGLTLFRQGAHPEH